MITMYFLRTWLKWLAGTALALVLERALLGWSWLLVLIATLTLLLFVIATWLIRADWRATRQQGVYRYDFVRDITRD